MGKGDEVFTPAGAAYPVFAGADRAERIEFSSANAWNIIFGPRTAAGWRSIVAKTSARREGRIRENKPLSLVEPVA